jgi:hypothetical protein
MALKSYVQQHYRVAGMIGGAGITVFKRIPAPAVDQGP